MAGPDDVSGGPESLSGAWEQLSTLSFTRVHEFFGEACCRLENTPRMVEPTVVDKVKCLSVHRI